MQKPCSFICLRSLNPSKVGFKTACLSHGSLMDHLCLGRLDLSVVPGMGQASKPSRWKRSIQVGFGVIYVKHRKKDLMCKECLGTYARS